MINAITVYDDFSPKLGLVVRKCLALLGMECLEARWSFSLKSVSEVNVYSDWNFKGSPPPRPALVTVPLSGPEETLILVC